MDLVSRREELLALGVPDRGLALLPSRFEELLADEWVLGVGHPDRLTRDEVAHLRQLLPGLTDTCHELARCGIPESLDHQDLNDGNIFVGDRGSIFFDWSEASITHPFFSLRTVVVSVELTLDLEEGAAPLEELRDAYLEPWTRYVAREDLLRAFQLARRLWMIPAALAWHRILSSLEGREREEYAYTVPWLLKELLAANA
jgi:Ser/Thr protein kinase RdoA (MazF antagonist)